MATFEKTKVKNDPSSRSSPKCFHWFKVAHPGDGAAEKKFFLACPLTPMGKNHDFLS